MTCLLLLAWISLKNKKVYSFVILFLIACISTKDVILTNIGNGCSSSYSYAYSHSFLTALKHILLKLKFADSYK